MNFNVQLNKYCLVHFPYEVFYPLSLQATVIKLILCNYFSKSYFNETKSVIDMNGLRVKKNPQTNLNLTHSISVSADEKLIYSSQIQK